MRTQLCSQGPQLCKHGVRVQGRVPVLSTVLDTLS